MTLRFFLFAFAFAFIAATYAAEPKPPVFPTEIHLTSGATLRNCAPLRWTNDYVIVKHLGGADPIRYVHIAEPDRSVVLAFRAAAPATPPAKAPASRVLTGQVFVTTQGAGAYKFAGATVYAFPLADMEKVKSNVDFRLNQYPNLQKMFDAWTDALRGKQSIATARTDAEGKYAFRLSAGQDVFLFCHANRYVRGGYEHHFWIAPAPADANTLNLDGESCSTQYDLEDRAFTPP